MMTGLKPVALASSTFVATLGLLVARAPAQGGGSDRLTAVLGSAAAQWRVSPRNGA
jgi:hypothetical protein